MQIQPCPIKETLTAIRSVLSWLGQFEYDQGEHSIHLTFRFRLEAEPQRNMKVMVEINTREHKYLLGLKKYPFKIDNQWYQEEAELIGFEPDEFFGTKLRALLQRRKNRDLFDIYQGLLQLSLDSAKVVAKI